MKQLYEIYNGLNNRLLDDNPTIESDSPSKAIRTWLKNNNINLKVKISGDNDVIFGVFPACIGPDGKVWRLGGKRQSWFAIEPERLE
jgi:hypothetical protein